jgi:hypothetical protein
MEHDLGWRDPVNVLLALRVTVQTICRGHRAIQPEDRKMGNLLTVAGVPRTSE